MARLPRHPRFWLGAFLLWFAILWLLSSFSLSAAGDYMPPISHFDKVEHFSYFFGGSLLLCGYLYRRNPTAVNWRTLIVVAVMVMALTGWLDEWHQTYTPGRSGNDPYDGLADLLGATAGAFVFKRIHRAFQ
jgi:VanZ family protein